MPVGAYFELSGHSTHSFKLIYRGLTRGVRSYTVGIVICALSSRAYPHAPEVSSSLLQVFDS
jgi:hypothetical protein